MTKGPLDELFPGWRDASATDLPGRDSDVHTRVLETPKYDGSVAFVLVVWRDPGGAAALHAAMRSAIESTLLSELSRPAADLLEDDESRRISELRVVVFDEVPGIEDALRAFGLRRAGALTLAAEGGSPSSDDEWLECLAQVRGEASREGHDIDAPASQWRAEFSTTSGVHALEAALRVRLDGHVFGDQPGFFFAALNDVLEKSGAAALPPRADSLDHIEALLTRTAPGRVHWIPPLAFQTLCDAIAVCAVKDLGRVVQWALGEAEESGFVPPPTLRMKDGAGWSHIPLGRDLLRWRVMPRQPDEHVPPLSAWLNDRFG